MSELNGSLILTVLTVAAGLAFVIARLQENLKYLLEIDITLTNKDQIDKSIQVKLNDLKKMIDELREVDVNNFVQAYRNRCDTKGLLEQHQPPTPKDLPRVQSGVDMDTVYDVGNFEFHSNILVIPAIHGNLHETRLRLFLFSIATGFGVFFAEFFELNLASAILQSTKIPHFMDLIITGVVIGGGSRPMTTLIHFATTRKIFSLKTTNINHRQESHKEPSNDSAMAYFPQEHMGNSYWRPILYDGGINPSSLEGAHLRSKPPNLVVYHHTAMSSSLPFQAVVDEFLVNKKWKTGYHCVIMPNGDIKPFCRWDRCGNHAMNFNDVSLGVAFHGNFHSDPRDSMSNYDGRYGNQRPTQAQLDAGGRLIALWMFLYRDIEDYSDIRPHSALNPGHTVCPGSNFLHTELKDRIAFYYEAWKKSRRMQMQLSKFRQLPYLYEKLGGEYDRR